MYKVIPIFILFFCINFYAQNNISKKITKHAFLKEETRFSRTIRFLEPKINKKRIKFNPITYLGRGFIYFYQTSISEQIQANCTYSISCSNFTKLNMEIKGPIIGFLIGLNQLSCCFSGVADDHEPCAITMEGKVDNSLINE